MQFIPQILLTLSDQPILKTMLLSAVLKINFLLAFETLVLIAAIFLLLNIKKQEAGKWLTFIAYAIILFIVGLMICTTANGCCREGEERESCHGGKMEKVRMEREMGMGHHGMMMMRGCGMEQGCRMGMMRSGCMENRSCCGMGGGMSCCKEMEEECEMEKEGKGDCCKKGMHGEDHFKMVKDTIVVKKK